MVKTLEVVTASASLTINCRKTKSLRLTRNANGLLEVGGEQIEAVDKFMYLGSDPDASGGANLDIESRIKKVFFWYLVFFIFFFYSKAKAQGISPINALHYIGLKTKR